MKNHTRPENDHHEGDSDRTKRFRRSDVPSPVAASVAHALVPSRDLVTTADTKATVAVADDPFYPSEPRIERVRERARRLLATTHTHINRRQTAAPTPLALLVPHASLSYSGTCAATAYESVPSPPPDTVWLLCTHHHESEWPGTRMCTIPPVQGAAAPTAIGVDNSAYHPPLSPATLRALHHEFAPQYESLVNGGRLRSAWAAEHSFRIQYALIRSFWPAACVHAIVVSRTTPAPVEKEVVDVVARECRRPSVLLVATTDWMHTPPSNGPAAERVVEEREDAAVASLCNVAAAGEKERFFRVLADDGACGRAVLAWLAAVAVRNQWIGRVLCRYRSTQAADLDAAVDAGRGEGAVGYRFTGHRRRLPHAAEPPRASTQTSPDDVNMMTVGYASIAFVPAATADPASLPRTWWDDAHCLSHVMNVVRWNRRFHGPRSARFGHDEDSGPRFAPWSPWRRIQCPAFVTLYDTRTGAVRACMGSLVETESAAHNIDEAARSVATNDSRFPFRDDDDNDNDDETLLLRPVVSLLWFDEKRRYAIGRAMEGYTVLQAPGSLLPPPLSQQEDEQQRRRTAASIQWGVRLRLPQGESALYLPSVWREQAQEWSATRLLQHLTLKALRISPLPQMGGKLHARAQDWTREGTTLELFTADEVGEQH